MKGGTYFKAPLPGNDMKDTHRLMGGIYEVCRSDGPMCHDIYTKFHTDSFRHLKVNGVRVTQTARLSHKPICIFSK
jgi:hypothetical protein